LPDAVYVLTDQRISFANPAGLELLKAESLTQILGLRPEEFLIAQHHQTVRQLFEIGKNERIPGPQYFQCKALDGSRIDLEIYSRGFVLDNTPAILITARKQRSSPAAYPIMISSQYPSSRTKPCITRKKFSK
jgi:PAS domain-containing protein